MPRIQSAGPEKATLGRRRLLACGAALTLAGCGPDVFMTVSKTPKLDMARLNRAAVAIAGRAAPRRLGAGLMNLESGEIWSFGGERPYPLGALFTLPLAAAVLSEIEEGRLSPDAGVDISELELSPPYSPIADAWPGRRLYSVRSLLTAAMTQGDNTAADVLMRLIGGPGAVSAWLQAKDLDEIRVDRYAREVLADRNGLASFRAAWRGTAGFARALAGAPEAVRTAALARYLRDPRDTATPRGMLRFLSKLLGGELLPQASGRALLRLTRGPAPWGLAGGLPGNASFARALAGAPPQIRSGPVFGDVGIITLADKRQYAAAAFLAGAGPDLTGADSLLADVSRAMTRGAGQSPYGR